MIWMIWALPFLLGYRLPLSRLGITDASIVFLSLLHRFAPRNSLNKLNFSLGLTSLTLLTLGIAQVNLALPSLTRKVGVGLRLSGRPSIDNRECIMDKAGRCYLVRVA